MTDVLSPVKWIDPLGWFHLIAFGVAIPLMVVLARRGIVDPAKPLPDRVKHFRGATINLLLFGGFSVLTARRQHIELFTASMPSLVSIAAGVAAYFAAVAYMRPRWRRAVERNGRIVHLFMPANARERAWWIAVSLLAGTSEEITWRGVQTVLLSTFLGSYVLAVLACAVMFGVAHWIQGARSAAVITVFALGFAALVWVSGSLYVAMVVHVAYDVTAGLSYGKLGRELGYRVDAATQQALDAAQPPGPAA